jgi:hypothetical protein
MRFLNELLDRLGGASFRLDRRPRAVLRAAQAVARHPDFLLRRALPFAWRLLRRVGTARADYLSLVSHHFMSAAEIATPLGRERLALCAFKVPVEGRLEPMCAVNALGLRERVYRPRAPERSAA